MQTKGGFRPKGRFVEVFWPIRQKALFDFLASRACSLTPEYSGLHSLAIGLGFMAICVLAVGHLAFGLNVP